MYRISALDGITKDTPSESIIVAIRSIPREITSVDCRKQFMDIDTDALKEGLEYLPPHVVEVDLSNNLFFLKPIAMVLSSLPSTVKRVHLKDNGLDSGTVLEIIKAMPAATYLNLKGNRLSFDDKMIREAFQSTRLDEIELDKSNLHRPAYGGEAAARSTSHSFFPAPSERPGLSARSAKNSSSTKTYFK